VPVDVEELATIAVDCGFKAHDALGPGLLESVYEAVLAQSLMRRGLAVERQKPIPFRFDGIILDEGFRADILVEALRAAPWSFVLSYVDHCTDDQFRLMV